MLGRIIVGCMAGLAIMASTAAAQAACSGVPASADALQNFVNKPASWLGNEGNGSLAADIQALAVAASANPDMAAGQGNHYTKFQEALKTAVAGANSDQAKAMGSALGALARTCGKAGAEEAAFVTAAQLGIASSGNQVADAAYGDALKEPQTASTGGAAGGGNGVGGQTGAGGTGGTNTGGPLPGNFGTPNGAENFAVSGLGTSGVLTGATGTTSTTTTTVTCNGSVSCY